MSDTLRSEEVSDDNEKTAKAKEETVAKERAEKAESVSNIALAVGET